MKRKSFSINAFGIRALIILISLSSFSLINHSDAQSVVGKWKRTSVKQTVTDASGKQQQLPQFANTEEIIEFKADKTFTSTDNGITSAGTYTISGKELRVLPGTKNEGANKLPPNVTITSINGNTMMWTYGSEMKNGKGKITIEETFVKL